MADDFDQYKVKAEDFDQYKVRPTQKLPPTYPMTEGGARGEGDPGEYQRPISPAETFVEHAGNRAGFGIVPALTGAATALEMKREGDPRPFGDIYRNAVQGTKQDLSRGELLNPMAATAGKGAGIASTLLLPAGRAAQGLGAAAKTAAGVGAIYGGIGGLAGGKGLETLNPGQAALDTAVGAGTGAGTGLVLGPVSNVLARGASPVARYIGGKLEEYGLNAGRRFLQGGRGTLTAKNPLSDEAVRAAVDSGALKAGSDIATTAERLEGVAQERGNQYAKVVADLEAAGFKGPDAQALAQKWMEQSKTAAANSLSSPVPKLYSDTARELAGKVGGTTQSDAVRRLVASGEFTPEQAAALFQRSMGQQETRLGLTQAENMKRTLQDPRLYDKLEPTGLQSARMDLASDMRQAVEDTVAKQAETASPEMQRVAASFVPAKQALGPILEASRAAQEGATRAANRSGVGLRDAILMGGELAHGAGPLGLVKTGLVGAASKALRERGPSAVAVGGLRGSDAMNRLAEATDTPVQRYIAGLLSSGTRHLSPGLEGGAGEEADRQLVGGGTQDPRHP